MAKKKSNLDILKYSAKKLGYKVELVDAPYSKAISVSQGQKMFIARSKKKYGMYPTNLKFSEHLVNDKAATKRILKKYGFRVIKGKIFHISPPMMHIAIQEKDTVQAAFKYAEKIKYPIFVKPNSGSQGAHARIIFNKSALHTHIRNMKKSGVQSFLIEKFTDRPEYRLFVVNGRVQFLYKKERTIITGNGISTINELIDESNFQPDQSYLQSLLRWERKTLQSVLGHEQSLTLQETANISLGAKITEYAEKVPKEVNQWAKKLQQTTGLSVFGVDVFTKDGINNPEEYLIIEINSNPALTGIWTKGKKDKVLDIWKRILDQYFKN